MKIIEAERLQIEYWEYDHGESTAKVQYCWEFRPNGLIMFESESTANWFFNDKDHIELCGRDICGDITSIGEFQEFTALELARLWGDSVKEFGYDSSICNLVQQLLNE